MVKPHSRYGPQTMMLTTLVVAAIAAFITVPLGAEEHGLRPGSLPAEQLAISPASQQSGLIISQRFIPSQAINLTQSHSFTIGSRSLELFVDGGRVSLGVDGQTMQLKRQGDSFAPAAIPLDDNQPYQLIFPIYRTVRRTHYVSVRSGVVMGGRIGRQTIFIYDDNMDGSYLIGQDAYSYGRSPILAPLNELIGTGNDIYRVTDLAADGSRISTEKYDGPTGTLNVEARGGPVALFVVLEHDQEPFALPTEAGSGRLTVIPGSYQISHGIAAGRRGEAFAMIGPGDFEAVEVAANGRASYVFGGPYSLRFTARKAGNNITITPGSIQLYGINGEQYTGFDHQSAPRVSTLSGDSERPLGQFTYT